MSAQEKVETFYERMLKTGQITQEQYDIAVGETETPKIQTVESFNIVSAIANGDVTMNLDSIGLFVSIRPMKFKQVRKFLESGGLSNTLDNAVKYSENQSNLPDVFVSVLSTSTEFISQHVFKEDGTNISQEEIDELDFNEAVVLADKVIETADIKTIINQVSSLLGKISPGLAQRLKTKAKKN